MSHRLTKIEHIRRESRDPVSRVVMFLIWKSNTSYYSLKTEKISPDDLPTKLSFRCWDGRPVCLPFCNAVETSEFYFDWKNRLCLNETVPTGYPASYNVTNVIATHFYYNYLPLFIRYWWRIMETKYVGDNLRC